MAPSLPAGAARWRRANEDGDKPAGLRSDSRCVAVKPSYAGRGHQGPQTSRPKLSSRLQTRPGTQGAPLGPCPPPLLLSLGSSSGPTSFPKALSSLEEVTLLLGAQGRVDK